MNGLYVGADTVRILVSSDQTGGGLALCDVVVAPGGGPPMHVHARGMRPSTCWRASSPSG
ncbi:MAG: hypothetical protein MUC89_22030 [Acetobacteraceae bacterium]|jgi:hypothetical protein|nr:hypothetical protein [Acetobacteraceae bacterium]